MWLTETSFAIRRVVHRLEGAGGGNLESSRMRSTVRQEASMREEDRGACRRIPSSRFTRNREHHRSTVAG